MPDFKPLIEQALRDRNFVSLREALGRREPVDVAEAIEALDPEERAVVFRVLPRELAADVFEYLSPEAQEALIKALGGEHVAAILNEMAPDDRTALLEELPAAATKQALALLTPEERQIARQLLGYPEESIGRLMTPELIAVPQDWTVQQTLDHIRQQGRDSETLNVIYVVDERGKLIDDLRMRRLLLTDPATRMRDLMDGHFVALKATEDQETAVRMFSDYDRFALPVTDSNGVLLGTVTVDDVLDVAEEEATEDIQKIGGVEALDDPYMETPFWRMLKKRARWLVVLFVGEMLTASAMGFFQREIERAVVLALFIPLIISSGGNSGSQAATLVIRAMALGEVGLRDWWRVIRREFLSGLSLGVILGVIGLVRVLAWQEVAHLYGPHGTLVAITVAVALVGVVLWGTIVGSMLPFVLQRFGADPAASSTPFVATLVDVTGLVIYFSVAAVVLVRS
ncbi:MAG TPA: magnesium transporter [Candidatus Polarisedimenticolaceae bacterium]|nr:magnesium transporter [Candidatus Polarisedimenticolaceae bacterium]